MADPSAHTDTHRHFHTVNTSAAWINRIDEVGLRGGLGGGAAHLKKVTKNCTRSMKLLCCEKAICRTEEREGQKSGHLMREVSVKHSCSGEGEVGGR